MTIGVDFDNTIVCYDQVFHKVALNQGLIPPKLPVSKGKVRDYLRQCGKENVWIDLQGYVYGARMREAELYPGAADFFIECRKQSIPVYIVSHKTLHPYQGPPYDLHQAAQEWLELQGFYDPKKIGLSRNEVFFDLTKQEKLKRIGELRCTYFIDDLPEFFSEPAFPLNVQRILFDPNCIYNSCPSRVHTTSWAAIKRILLEDTKVSS